LIHAFAIYLTLYRKPVQNDALIAPFRSATMYTLIRWFVMAVAVWIAAAIVPGISYEDWQSLAIAAVVLGMLNAFVKPVLGLLSLPLIVLTMGLFLPVLNALMLMLTAWLVHGFHVGGFWSAVAGSIVISLVSLFLGYSGQRRRMVVEQAGFPHHERRGPPPGSGPIIDV
jgi:putative membrane protein